MRKFCVNQIQWRYGWLTFKATLICSWLQSWQIQWGQKFTSFTLFNQCMHLHQAFTDHLFIWTVICYRNGAPNKCSTNQKTSPHSENSFCLVSCGWTAWKKKPDMKDCWLFSFWTGHQFQIFLSACRKIFLAAQEMTRCDTQMEGSQKIRLKKSLMSTLHMSFYCLYNRILFKASMFAS